MQDPLAQPISTAPAFSHLVYENAGLSQLSYWSSYLGSPVSLSALYVID